MSSQNEWEQRRIAKATKVPLHECTEPLMYNDDEFFTNVDDLLSHLASEADPDATAYPLVAWCCDLKKPQIDIERWRENFEEQLELGDGTALEDVTEDLQGIIAAMTAWNDKQRASLYYASDTRCVLINKSDIFSDPTT